MILNHYQLNQQNMLSNHIIAKIIILTLPRLGFFENLKAGRA